MTLTHGPTPNTWNTQGSREHRPALEKEREMGPEGRAGSQVAVTVAHSAQGPTQAATTSHTTAQATEVQPWLSSFLPFVHLLHRTPTLFIYVLKSCPSLNNSEAFFQPLQAEVLFPYSEVPQSILYILFTHSYFLVHLVIDFFNSYVAGTVLGTVSFDNYCFMFLSYFYKQTVIY